MEALEPVPQAVSRDDLRAAKHLPAHAADDAVLDACLQTAQAVVETACARPMGKRQMVFSVAAGDWHRWWFPVAPVVSIDGIEMADGAGGWDPVLADVQLQFGWRAPQLVVPSSGLPEIGSELRIIATVGYDTGKWPLQMAQAIKLLAAEWYEAGISPEGVPLSELSFAAKNLIRQVRYIRPFEFGAA
jgi:uncharacterized phiE125 gp8 family phage protein